MISAAVSSGPTENCTGITHPSVSSIKSETRTSARVGIGNVIEFLVRGSKGNGWQLRSGLQLSLNSTSMRRWMSRNKRELPSRAKRSTSASRSALSLLSSASAADPGCVALSRTETIKPTTASSQMKRRSVKGLFQHPRLISSTRTAPVV